MKFARTFSSIIRSTINALMIAALLAGLIPPPFFTQLAHNAAPTALEPIVEEAASAAADMIDAIAPTHTALAAPGDNIAPNGTVSQSSILNGFGCNGAGPACGPGRAIDGFTDGVYNNGNIVHTEAAGDEWWQVDLGSVKMIDTINVYGRTDCCPGGTTTASVFVSDIPFSDNTFATAQTEADFAQQIGAYTSGNLKSLTVNTLGRYVRVQQNGAGLFFAELQVIEGVPPVEPGEIMGTVFLDGDTNGAQNAGEGGLENITVTATDASGTTTTATTDASGTYTITAAAGLTGTVRVEFTLPTDGSLDHLEPTVAGETSVQFADVTTGAIMNAGFHNPVDYCDSDPLIAISCFENGSGAGNSNPALVSFSHSASGIPQAYGGSAENPRADADVQTLGSVWGAAYDSATHYLYNSAFLKRHVALGDGPGYVYVMDYSNTASPSLAGSFDLQGATPANGGAAIDLGAVCRSAGCAGDAGNTGIATDYTLEPSTTTANRDLDAFDKIGKISYGNIDLENGTLWLTNLNQRALISIDVSGYTPSVNGPAPATVNQYLIDNIGGPSCASSAFRPFALTVEDGVGYLGGVCPDDLEAHVLTFNPANPAGGLTSAATFPLNYTREGMYANSYNNQQILSTWGPWISTWAQVSTAANVSHFAFQPILSDIEVADDGNLTLGFIDRFGHQSGHSNYTAESDSMTLATGYSSGDIHRLCNVNGVYVREGQAGCAENDNGSQPADEGDGGNGNFGARGDDGLSNTGEFYYGDYYDGLNADQFDTANHLELSTGGLALFPSSGEVINTVFDPILTQANGGNGTFTQGLHWYNTSSGARTDAYTVVPSVNTQFFGKAAGLGEPEVICAPAPLEVGNRVWSDVDNDGVQDPDEAGMSGVVVGLYDIGNTLIATATTDSEGNYYFSGGTGTDSDSAKYGLTDLTHSTTGYEVRIDITQPTIGGRLPSPANSGAGANGDLHDSDGTLDGSNAEAAFDTGTAGANNHTYDFGFSLNLAPATLEIIKQVNGGSVTDPFSVDVTGPNNYSSTVSVTPGTPTIITDLQPGTYTVVEESPVSVAAPAGLAWLGTTYAPADGRVALTSGSVGQMSITNVLGELPASSGVLTVTKAVDWNGNTPNGSQQFSYNIEGSNGFTTINDTITDTGVMTYSVPSGTYTVTEASPGAGWVTTYTVSSTVSSMNGVVDLSAGTIVPVTAAAISGTVFRDFNSDGALTTGEVGLAGVTVTMYDPSGTPVGSTQTITDGIYSLTPTGDGPWRVEFTDLPNGYEPSFLGSNNDSSVQFVTTSGAANVDFAVNAPCDYCQSNPLAAVPVWGNGNPLDISGNVDEYSFWRAFPYNASGTSGVTYDVNGLSIGALHGQAWQSTTSKLYASAVVRRHVGLGPQGLGGIYLFDLSGGGAPAVSSFVDLDAAPFNIDFGDLPDNTGRNLPLNRTSPSADPAAYAAAGIQGIGDIELTGDERTLFVVNLFNRSLIQLDVAGGSVPNTATETVIDTLPGAPTCSNGILRPWALKFRLGKGYLGVVCDASNGGTRDDLDASILEFTPSALGAGFTSVLNWTFNYTKGLAITAEPAGVYSQQWYPWLHVYSNAAYDAGTRTSTGDFHVGRPMPAVADIEFDATDSMIIAVTDIGALQFGYKNSLPDGSQSGNVTYHVAGDILRACRDVNGNFVLESGGACGGITAGGANGQGPGGGEFYAGDQYAPGGNGHEETAHGGLAQLMSDPKVMTPVMDPFTFVTGGVARLSNTTGDAPNSDRLELYNGTTQTTGRSGKSAGMGDIELLCDPAPLQIGNRVWDDYNGDGVQDAGEPGLNNVQVTLEQAGQAAQNVNTSGDGNYVFSVEPNTPYTITVATPADYTLTTPNAEAVSGSATSNDAINDVRDSDALLVNGTPTIIYTTGGAGQNNHGLDFGFAQAASGQVDILNKAPEPQAGTPMIAVDKQLNTTPGDPSFSVGETVSFTIRITNTGDVVIDTLPLEDRYSSVFLTYQSATPAETTAADGIITWNDLLSGDPDGLGISETVSVDVYFTTAADTTLMPAVAPCTVAGHAPNIARSVGATSSAGSVVEDADDTSCDSVQVLNPTAVQLAARSISQTPDGVLVKWATVSESNIVGFHIWKSNGTAAELRSGGMILATNTGQFSGSSYHWLDRAVTLNQGDIYVLEVINNDGTTERAVIDVMTGENTYLPLIAR